MKFKGYCLPYGKSKYHDSIKVGAFAHQDGEKVPLVSDFWDANNPENVIGHCVLHDTDEGVMCDIHFNEEFLQTHYMEGFCSYNKIGAWVVQIEREPILAHELPSSKFNTGFVVTHGRIAAVGINHDCLEEIEIVEEI